MLYYGIGVGVTNFDYRLESNYSERINNGVILGSEKEVVSGEYNMLTGWLWMVTELISRWELYYDR